MDTRLMGTLFFQPQHVQTSGKREADDGPTAQGFEQNKTSLGIVKQGMITAFPRFWFYEQVVFGRIGRYQPPFTGGDIVQTRGIDGTDTRTVVGIDHLEVNRHQVGGKRYGQLQTGAQQLIVGHPGIAIRSHAAGYSEAVTQLDVGGTDGKQIKADDFKGWWLIDSHTDGGHRVDGQAKNSE